MIALGTSTCYDCRHFKNDPSALEAALPGLASLSSGYAAVRLDDGLCAENDRYVKSSCHCVRYAAA